MFWKHLSLAKILPGTYTGSRTGSSSTILVGTDVPEIGIRNAGAHVVFDSYWWVLDSPDDMIMFGKELSGAHPVVAYLTPNEAYSVDLKIDDGHPVKGFMFAGTSTGAIGTCVNGTGFENISNGDATAYVLTNEEIACRTGFSLNVKK